MKYKLLTIKTTKFSFTNNAKSNTTYQMKPKFQYRYDNANDKYNAYLTFLLYDNDKTMVPYNINLEIMGSFAFDDAEENQIIEFMNNNALLILYPYLRTIISTTLTALQVQSFNLPIVDPRTLFN